MSKNEKMHWLQPEDSSPYNYSIPDEDSIRGNRATRTAEAKVRFSVSSQRPAPFKKEGRCAAVFHSYPSMRGPNTMSCRVFCGLSILFWGASGLRAQARPIGEATPESQSGRLQPVADTSADEGPTTASSTAKAPPAALAAQEIANQANNPAAPVTLIQLRNILLPAASLPGLVPNVRGTGGTVNSFQLQPVLPIGPFHSFPLVQLIKITMPFPMLQSSGPASSQQVDVTGRGDLEVFDLFTVKQSWGRWGFGPALAFPTASVKALGAGKWQAGPSVALIYTGVKNLTVGAIVQSFMSYAGSPNRPNVNNMVVTPTFTFNLKEGWFVGMSDYNWSFNWESGGAPTIPLGLQFGKVVTLGKQPVSMSVEAGGAAARPANTASPGWILGFEFTPIFNWHVGPREKVELRKQ